MAAEVVSLHGDTQEGEPDPEIVAKIEWLLAQAKAGQITSFAYCATHPGASVGTGWSGIHGTSFALGGAVAMLNTRYSTMLLTPE